MQRVCYDRSGRTDIGSELCYSTRDTTDLFALQVHIVVSNLGKNSDEIDQVNQIPLLLNWNNTNLGTSMDLHVGIC